MGPNGVALFSASQSNNYSSATFSNLVKNSNGTADPALSRDAIQFTRALGLTHKDPNNLVRPVNLDILIVPPSLEDAAERMIFSEGIYGSPNREINPLKNKIKILVWPRLETRSDATDTSKYWFMADSSKVKDTLQAIFAKKPSLDPPEVIYASKSWEWSLFYYYVVGLGLQDAIFGSRGTA